MPIEVEEIPVPGDDPPPRPPPPVGPDLETRRPRLSVDGVARPDLDASLLGSHLVRPLDDVGRCEVRLDLHAPDAGDSPAPVGTGLGVSLALDLPAGPDLVRVFTGHVSGHELRCSADRPPELTLVAEDGLRSLRTARRTRTFQHLTDTEIIEVIAADHGIDADIQLEGPTRPLLVQADRSDLGFVRDRVHALDAGMCMRGEVLEVRQRSSVGPRDGAVELRSGQQLLDLELSADLTDQYTSVQVTGWSVDEARTVVGQATAADLDAAGRGERTGIATARTVFGPRALELPRSTLRTDDDARSTATTELRRRARRFVTGQAITTGEPRVVPGGHVVLAGVDRRFVGTYEVVAVEHTFGLEHGHRTRVELCRPTITEVRA